MKFDAWPVDPPGFGIGPLSMRTMSFQPRFARWYAMLLPTMPAPTMTTFALEGNEAMNTAPVGTGAGGAEAPFSRRPRRPPTRVRCRDDEAKVRWSPECRRPGTRVGRAVESW